VRGCLSHLYAVAVETNGDQEIMPHATDPPDAANDEDDDILIGRVLNPGDPTELENGLDLQRELEPGEKADDAVDFGDLSNDDLADDDDVDDAQDLHQGQPSFRRSSSDGLEVFMQDQDLPTPANGTNLEDDGMDDLFGDGPSSPTDVDPRMGHAEDDFDPEVMLGNDDEAARTDSGSRRAAPLSDTRGQSFFHRVSLGSKDAPLSREQQLQMELFQMSRPGQETLPAPPENQEELLSSLWPKFQRDTIPKFIDLLPPKKARYVGKVIPKPPKPVFPTKISLELAQDQEKSFKIWPASHKRSHEDTEQLGNVVIEQDSVDYGTPEEYVDIDSDFENDAVGGISWQDLQIVCADWDAPSVAESLESEQVERLSFTRRGKDTFDHIEHEEDLGMEWPPSKVSGTQLYNEFC